MNDIPTNRLFLLDANVLINAHEDYYPIDSIPQFWDWLIVQATNGFVKIPYEIFEELNVYEGALKDWINNKVVKDALLLDEVVDVAALNTVLNEGYGTDLLDNEIERIGQDPFLISYALNRQNRVIITKENSAPAKKRANRKIPDVCASVRVSCMRDFEMFKLLKFNTKT